MAEWVQTRPRNEALDCLLLALVALRLSGLDLKNAKVGASETAPPPPTPPPPPTFFSLTTLTSFCTFF